MDGAVSSEPIEISHTGVLAVAYLPSLYIF